MRKNDYENTFGISIVCTFLQWRCASYCIYFAALYKYFSDLQNRFTKNMLSSPAHIHMIVQLNTVIKYCQPTKKKSSVHCIKLVCFDGNANPSQTLSSLLDFAKISNQF